MAELKESEREHRFYRRAAHAGRCRFGRRHARRGEYSETGTFTRRDSVYRCDDAGRISQDDRKRPRARTPFSGRQGRAAERGRGAYDHRRASSSRYEAFHQIRYSKDALEAAVYQSNRYIPDRFLPDKAIDVLDEAGARAKLRYQTRDIGEPSWKETVDNWKRAAANEDQLISYELQYARRFVLRRRGDQGRRR